MIFSMIYLMILPKLHPDVEINL